VAFWASQMEGSSNKLECRLCGSKSILRIHPVSTTISHLIHSSITYLTFYSRTSSYGTPVSTIISHLIHSSITYLTFYSLTSSYDTPVSTIISHLILFHYLTFYSQTSHPLLISHFILWLLSRIWISVDYYMWYLTTYQWSHRWLIYSVLTKVGFDSVYLADMILRLGSLPYLGYLIDRVATVASSPLPASSSKYPNLCNSGWLGGEKHDPTS